MKRRFSCVILLGLMVLCFQWGAVFAQESRTLTIFAAASLTDVFSEIGETFKTAHPGLDIVFNFGGSSSLAAQLSEGAPADIFASANNTQMTVAEDAGRIAGEPVTFARNRLVLIVPADNPANIESLKDLANSGIKVVFAAPAVPVRDYTDAMLEKLADDPAYGEAYRTAVLGNLVSEEPNVRQVSAKIALGEADAGIVYRSDVTPDIADSVQMLPIPDEVNTIASYPVAVTNDSTEPELAQAFINYLLSDAGQAALASWNFVPLCAETMESQPESESTAEATSEAEMTPQPDATPDCPYA